MQAGGPVPGKMQRLLNALVKEVAAAPQKLEEMWQRKLEVESRIITTETGSEESHALWNQIHQLNKQIEAAKIRHSSYTAILNLYAALVNAGMAENAQMVLETLGANKSSPGTPSPGNNTVVGENNSTVQQEKAQEKQQPQQNQHNKSKQQNGQQSQNSDTENQKSEESTGQFLIKEIKPGKKEGTIWAIAVAADGTEYNICCKNGVAQKASESIGKQVSIMYRQMDKNKLFAAKIQ